MYIVKCPLDYTTQGKAWSHHGQFLHHKVQEGPWDQGETKATLFRNGGWEKKKTSFARFSKFVAMSVFFKESALRPILSSSRDVRLCVCLSPSQAIIFRSLIGPQVT